MKDGRSTTNAHCFRRRSSVLRRRSFMMIDSLVLPAIPVPLSWGLPPVSYNIGDDGALAITAGPRTDMFVNPDGTSAVLNTPRLVFAPVGDFMLSARVTVEFAA